MVFPIQINKSQVSIMWNRIFANLELLQIVSIIRKWDELSNKKISSYYAWKYVSSIWYYISDGQLRMCYLSRLLLPPSAYFCLLHTFSQNHSALDFHFQWVHMKWWESRLLASTTIKTKVFYWGLLTTNHGKPFALTHCTLTRSMSTIFFRLLLLFLLRHFQVIWFNWLVTGNKNITIKNC